MKKNCIMVLSYIKKKDVKSASHMRGHRVFRGTLSRVFVNCVIWECASCQLFQSPTWFKINSQRPTIKSFRFLFNHRFLFYNSSPLFMVQLFIPYHTDKVFPQKNIRYNTSPTRMLYLTVQASYVQNKYNMSSERQHNSHTSESVQFRRRTV